MRKWIDKISSLTSGLSFLDSRWPTGFKTFVLIGKSKREGNILFISKEEETAYKIEREINSLSSYSVRALIVEGDEWYKALRSSIPSIFIGIEGKTDPNWLKKSLSEVEFIKIERGFEIERDDLIERLIEEGYRRVGYVELEGEIAVRGGILDIFPPGENLPKRIEFFGDFVESIREFDPETQRSLRELERIEIAVRGKGREVPIKIYEEKPQDLPLRVYPNPPLLGRIEIIQETVKELHEKGYEAVFFTSNDWKRKRFEEIFSLRIERGALFHGFIFENAKLAVFSEYELTGYYPVKRKKEYRFGERIEDLSEILPGDYVVHIDYGIAKYEGLKKVRLLDSTYDCLSLRYRDGRVLVPSYNLDKVQRFVGTYEFDPPLSSLSSSQWLIKKARAQKALLELANEILKIHAERKVRRGFSFSPDTVWQKELEAEFPYEETEDQARVIEEVKRDMESPKVMDRLVAGEVGFGKTEVALRAAFKAVNDGKQVAVLVPTTILAFQHYRTFKERLKSYPVRIEMVSRLKTREEIKEILRDLALGKVDIVIGTHRLLQDDVSFNNLGLLIIDEEHRFGVLQKEKIRKLHTTVDTLRLTATPIPRTLYAALGKIYDLSIILTPPSGRQEVNTIVTQYSESLVKEAITREMERGGQVFYVYNRIETIGDVAARLKKLFPQLRIKVVHGRMRRDRIEEIFLEFYGGKIDVLVSTSIIEAGIDFPNANTLIVERADLFGLAELHQLRGRVGRSNIKAYAYFLVPKKISKNAMRRLKALETYHHLGSGLKIALADLEIRGAGNLLGKEQHGHINTIGYELYFQLLEETIQKLAGKMRKKFPEIVIEGVDAYIPEEYIEESEVRVAFYRRLAKAETIGDVQFLAEEMRDRFGPIPPEVGELLLISAARVWAKGEDVERVVWKKDVVKIFKNGRERILRRDILLNKIGGKDEKKIDFFIHSPVH
jgi:transcription-repair coupling factor (superfamily II helicase)